MVALCIGLEQIIAKFIVRIVEEVGFARDAQHVVISRTVVFPRHVLFDIGMAAALLRVVDGRPNLRVLRRDVVVDHVPDSVFLINGKALGRTRARIGRRDRSCALRGTGEHDASDERHGGCDAEAGRNPSLLHDSSPSIGAGPPRRPRLLTLNHRKRAPAMP